MHPPKEIMFQDKIGFRFNKEGKTMKIYRNEKGDEIIVPITSLQEEGLNEAIAAVVQCIATGKARGGNLVFSDYYDEYNDAFNVERRYTEGVETPLPEFYWGETKNDYRTKVTRSVRRAFLGSIVTEAKFVLWANK